jgi:hypothetical protein
MENLLDDVIYVCQICKKINVELPKVWIDNIIIEFTRYLYGNTRRYPRVDRKQ